MNLEHFVEMKFAYTNILSVLCVNTYFGFSFFVLEKEELSDKRVKIFLHNNDQNKQSDTQQVDSYDEFLNSLDLTCILSPDPKIRLIELRNLSAALDRGYDINQIDHEILELIFRRVCNGNSDNKIIQELLNILAYIGFSSDEVCTELLPTGYLDLLLDILSVNHESSIITQCLDCIHNVLYEHTLVCQTLDAANIIEGSIFIFDNALEENDYFIFPNSNNPDQERSCILQSNLMLLSDLVSYFDCSPFFDKIGDILIEISQINEISIKTSLVRFISTVSYYHSSHQLGSILNPDFISYICCSLEPDRNELNNTIFMALNNLCHSNPEISNLVVGSPVLTVDFNIFHLQKREIKNYFKLISTLFEFSQDVSNIIQNIGLILNNISPSSNISFKITKNCCYAISNLILMKNQDVMNPLIDFREYIVDNFIAMLQSNDLNLIKKILESIYLLMNYSRNFCLDNLIRDDFMQNEILETIDELDQPPNNADYHELIELIRQECNSE
ncbi:hypothetical protein TVAG_138060 [Trichomonas vaginalis G3]|uniref:Uncharacterized protein n=1 Tax=Trichomonas vaginalis (strain ATCC PRA-98 / G3) TaxID=412133 RepID=A2EC37_TRIV3|nr:armadillo (ARM) repeat-containing protein family [Trichomonas vaginalis G3]EAY09812.1 hypothetical protein TVAG_138060 [Trichomonas vaginalis G3]KAI5525762.1 armadillo (ARM) repeat-containing protein family [Trichomonas vaginalis G3]|eukprot:XP_001322035.1 hypothetical protein [Trichomonas vaginalis G3]